VSQFGGPSWTLDPHTDQYYLHSFLRQQPDLNWRNAGLRKAMFDVLRFWLDRGVDGFRVDVIWLLIKDEQFRDNPPNPAYLPTQPDISRTLSVYNADQPEVHQLIAQMRAVLDGYKDRVLIGEIYLPFDRLVTYYGENLSGAQLPFNFALIHAAWNAEAIADLILEYERALPRGGWPNWVLGNHDQPRIASRVGEAQARIAAMLLLTLRGTPTMYYGDEIGMAHTDIPRQLAQDPWEKNEPGLGVSRDPSRTPLQWDETANGGFSSVTPWLPIGRDYKDRNVNVLRHDPHSILSFYRRLIELRRTYVALQVGDIANVAASNNVLTYARCTEGQRITLILNFSSNEQAMPAFATCDQSIMLSTHMDRKQPTQFDQLRPNEGIALLAPA
jgi:alpha-glucosidase